MKQVRKSTDGIGVVIWRYDNKAQIVRQPGGYTMSGRTEWHALRPCIYGHTIHTGFANKATALRWLRQKEAA